MKNWSHSIHVSFDSLFEKRHFCRHLNKFRQHGLIQIVDLGKDENGVSVEFSFPNQEGLDSFEKVLIKSAKQNKILK